MRKCIYLINLVVLLSVFFSCKDSDKEITESGVPLEIVASSDNIILLPENSLENALTFTWNQGLDRGEGTTREYCFKMDIAGNDFVTSIPLEVMGTDVYSRAFSVEELNDLLINYWKQQPGREVELEAKVIARVIADKFMMPEVATVKFKVTPYSITSVPIYIIGTAVGTEWNPSEAILMNEVEVNKAYTYKAQMSVGEYEFIRTQTSMIPGYIKGADDTQLLYRNDEQMADNRFVIDAEGIYEISINTKDLTHKCTYCPPYSRVFMVGDATPSGWEVTQATELTWIEGTDLFVYEGHLNSGEIKFPIDVQDWFTSFFMPVENYPELTDTRMEVVPTGGHDYKWLIQEAGNYKVTLDVKNLTIVFEKQ